jgi:hypothetical protein
LVDMLTSILSSGAPCGTARRVRTTAGILHAEIFRGGAGLRRYRE